MNDTETRLTNGGSAAPTDRPGTSPRQRRWALAILGGGLLFETVVLAMAGRRAPDLSHLTTLGLWLWWAIPFMLTGILLWWASGRTGVAWSLTVGLAVAITLAGVGGYIQTSRSVDASLIGLSGPLIQDAAVVLVGLVILVLNLSARRRSR